MAVGHEAALSFFIGNCSLSLSLSLSYLSYLSLSRTFQPLKSRGSFNIYLTLTCPHSSPLTRSGGAWLPHSDYTHAFCVWGFSSLKRANRQYGNNIHKNIYNIFHNNSTPTFFFFFFFLLNNSTPTYTYLNISPVLIFFYLLLAIWHVNFEYGKLSLKTKALWKV